MRLPDTNYIIIQRGTNRPDPLWSDDDRTPEGFAAFLYDVAKSRLQDGDRVYLCGYARFAREREWRLPSIELEGVPQPGGAMSELFTCCTIDAGGGKTAANTASIVLAERNVFRNLRLVGRCWNKSEDAAITGHDKGGGQYVEFDGCELDAAQDQDWGAHYQWSGNTNNGTTIVRNSVGWFSRFLVSECGSASPKAQLLVENTRLFGDAGGSNTSGATNRLNEQSACCPFLFRSGVARFTDVESTIHVPADRPAHSALGVARAVGWITNVYSSKAGPVEFHGRNVRSTIEQGYAAEAWDLDLRFGSPMPKIDNSEQMKRAFGGSAPNGGLLINVA